MYRLLIYTVIVSALTTFANLQVYPPCDYDNDCENWYYCSDLYGCLPCSKCSQDSNPIQRCLDSGALNGYVCPCSNIDCGLPTPIFSPTPPKSETGNTTDSVHTTSTLSSSPSPSNQGKSKQPLLTLPLYILIALVVVATPIILAVVYRYRKNNASNTRSTPNDEEKNAFIEDSQGEPNQISPDPNGNPQNQRPLDTIGHLQNERPPDSNGQAHTDPPPTSNGHAHNQRPPDTSGHLQNERPPDSNGQAHTEPPPGVNVLSEDHQRDVRIDREIARQNSDQPFSMEPVAEPASLSSQPQPPGQGTREDTLPATANPGDIEMVVKVASPLTANNSTTSTNEMPCTKTIIDLLNDEDLMSELKTYTTPKGVWRNLGSKFVELNYNQLDYIQDNKSSEDPTIAVVAIIKSKMPNLKLVEIIKYLQELGKNDIVLKFSQQWHPQCPACQIYYDKIPS